MADEAADKIEVKEPIVLTERELAIAHGQNPDITVPDPAPVEAVVPVETAKAEPVVETPPAAEAKPAETPAKPEPPSWLTGEHRELAASYGLSQDDLTDFGSAAEFTRATRIIDRQNAALGELARKQPAPETPPEKQNGHAAAAAQAVENANTAAKLAKLDLEKLKAAGYDEETLGVLAHQNTLVDEFEKLQKEREQERVEYQRINTQFSQWQQQQQAEQQAMRIASFHDAVDGLGDARFGKSLGDDGNPVQLGEKEDAERRKLYEMAETLAVGIVTRARAAGVPPQLPPMPVLLKRSYQQLYADDIRAEERKKVQQEITEQSKRRRPVAVVRQPVAPATKAGPQTTSERVQEIANHPEVVAAWDRIQQAAGAAV